MPAHRLSYLCLQATREGQASYAHVHEIINGLRTRGWIVDLYEPSYARTQGRIHPLRKLVEFFVVQVRFILSLYQSDAVYVRHHPAAVLGILFARLLRRPMLVELNGPHEDIVLGVPWLRPLERPLSWLNGAGLRLTENAVVGTEQLGAWLELQVGPRNKYVIPNGANTSLFNPSAGTSRVLPPTYAVFFGALAPWQGIDTILKAIELPDWPHHVELVVVGDGVAKDEVAAASSKNSRIHYLGTLPYRDVPGIVARSLVSLVAKNYPVGKMAGLSPLKVYESLACGVPIIVTDLPGQSDIVRQCNCGIIVDHQNPNALASAVGDLARNPEAAAEMGRRGRECVVSDHSWDQRAGLTNDALLAVLSRQPAPRTTSITA